MARFANGMQESTADMVEQINTFGSAQSNGNIAYGWAWAMAAPYPYVKKHAGHLGGVRNGMVLSWPARITGRDRRTQFAHVTDIMPTLLEAARIEAPSAVNGIAQQRIDGTSLFYSFDKADAAGRHNTQYFEMLGNRSIYHDGWWAGTRPASAPWHTDTDRLGHPESYAWELYNLRDDPAQAHDLAQEMPEKLAQMQALFAREARGNGVYPLDDRLNLARFAEAAGQQQRRNRFVFWGAGASLPAARAPAINGQSFAISAQVTLQNDSASGAIASFGSHFGGWSFYLDNGKPAVLLSASQQSKDSFQVSASQKLGAGTHQLVFRFDRQAGHNAPGMMHILLNGTEIARGPIARTISKLPELTDTFDIGFDASTSVDLGGAGSQPFTGTIEKVEVTTMPAPASAAMRSAAGGPGADALPHGKEQK